MDDKLIEYTIPEKPNSRLQKYRLTENGKSRARVRHQVTAQGYRGLKEDPNTLLNNMLQILSGSLEDLTAQVTAQVVWHCRLPRLANEIMEFLGLKHRLTDKGKQLLAELGEDDV